MNINTYIRLCEDEDITQEDYDKIEELVTQVQGICDREGWSLGDCSYYFFNKEAKTIKWLVEDYIDDWMSQEEAQRKAYSIGVRASDYADKLEEFGILEF